MFQPCVHACAPGWMFLRAEVHPLNGNVTGTHRDAEASYLAREGRLSLFIKPVDELGRRSLSLSPDPIAKIPQLLCHPQYSPGCRALEEGREH